MTLASDIPWSLKSVTGLEVASLSTPNLSFLPARLTGMLSTTSSAADVSRAPSTCSGMTAARRERKRLTDREAQKASRARTKQYIAYLEKTVADQARFSNQEHISRLSIQLDQQQKEIERLRAALKSVGRFASDACNTPLGDTADIHHRPSFPWPGLSHDAAHHDHSFDPGRVAPPGNSLVCGHGSRNYLQVMSDFLGMAEKSDRRIPFTKSEEDDDLAVRAVLHGWEAAKQSHSLDIAWQVLEMVDRGLFYRSGSVERVATLRLMRAMLMVRGTHTSVNAPRR